MSRYKTKDGWIKQRHNPFVLIAKYIGLPLLVCFMFISFAIGVNVQLKKYFDYKEQQRIEKQQKIEHEKWEKIEAEQEQKRQEYKERVEREKKEYEDRKKKDIGKAIYNKNIAIWNQVKDEYKIGTYVENVITHKRGQVVGYQGERVFVAVKDKNNNVIQEWWFDYGIDAIETVGFKDYAKYRNYIMLIQK